MVHRSIVCPINDCGVHTYFTTSLFLKHTCIFSQQAHDVDERRIDVSLILARHHVPAGYLFIVARHRRRGTIEMTLVRLCVHLSVIPSVRPSVRPIFSLDLAYIFHWTDLKFYRLPSYHMKMCMWFLIFVLAIFDQVMALADSYLVPATPATSFIELT